MAYKRRDDIIIEDASIGYSDFKGSRYAPSFMLIMNKGVMTYKGKRGYSDIRALIDEGWPIKQSTRDEDEWVMWVTVKFDVPDGMNPPSVYMETGKKREKLDGRTIGLLDNADISKVDVRITPAIRKDGAGYTAYAKTLFVTLYEDVLMASHGMYDDDNQVPSVEIDDDIPF